jgi:type VI secretion system VasI/ImpG family protein
MDLLDYYRDNLNYLRGLSSEFAAEFPKIARRLLLSEFDCEDPYIERLLEGTAFLAAKVEKKLDDGYYPFLESVLNSVAPNAVYPIPSGAVLELMVNMGDENIRRGIVLKAGTVFDTTIPGINTPCRFSCAEDSPLAPFSLNLAEYLPNVVSLGIKNAEAESALRLQFSAPGGTALSLTDTIQLFLNLSEADASLLLRLLAHDTVGVYIKNRDSGDYRALSEINFTIPMAAGENSFSHQIRLNSRGLRILQNFLAYPDFFKFFSIRGLGAAAGNTGAEADLVIVFSRREQALTGNIKTSSVRLNCVPVLNLFSRRSDRVTIEKENYEFHLIPDRTAMRDYEVVAVKNIDFYNEKNEPIFTAANFYDESAAGDKKRRNFFSVRRRKKLVERYSTARSTYGGTEVFVAFSPLEEDAYQFAADLLVTNRDLPLLLQAGAEFSSPSTLVQRANFMTTPTRPLYPLADRGDRADFARLSHIAFNLSACFWQEGDRSLEILRNMLRAYPLRPAEELDRMIHGIIGLNAGSDTFRFIRNGVVFYEWGWRLRLTLDENAYAGMGWYSFALIVAEILKSFTPINTFLEIHFNTLQSGNIAVWKTSEIQ